MKTSVARNRIFFILFSIILSANLANANIPANVQIGPPLAFNSFTASNNPIMTGNTQVLTAGIYNGFTPYTYTYNVYAPNGIIINTVSHSGITSNIDTWNYIQQSSWGYGTFTATINVLDDASVPEDVGGRLTYSVPAPPSCFAPANVIKIIPTGKSPYDVAFTPSGNLAYVVTSVGDSVNIINTNSNAIIKTISLPASSDAQSVGFTPNGKSAYVTLVNLDEVAQINVSTNTIGNIISTGASSGPYQLVVSPDGSNVYVTDFASQSVSIISTETNLVTNIIPFGDFSGELGTPIPQGIGISPSGKLLYVTDPNNNQVDVIDPARNTIIINITVGVNPQESVTFSPDGKLAYVTNLGSETVDLIDVPANMVISSIPTGPAIVSLFAFNGTVAYTTALNSVDTLGVASNSVINTLFAPSSYDIAQDPANHNILYATDPTNNSVYVIFTGAAINCSVVSGTTILLPIENYDSYFALILFIFAALLFIIRIISYESETMNWVIIDFISGLFMFLSAYYYTFAPISNMIGNLNLAGTITTVNVINQHSIPVTSQGFILLWIITIFYIMIMMLFALRDFLAARSAPR